MKLEDKLYAVVDVETTGGKPADTKITEIAIYITDGKNIIETYSTLINPRRPIDWYVIKLTGITNEMVSNERTFEDVSGEILNLLSDKIFVAHNVDFDYNIIRREFLEIGKPFDAKKLCTVKSARKVFPGLSSYSLGNISAHLNINLNNAHRASEDAKATADLLHLILNEAELEFLQNEIVQQNHIIELPDNWRIRNDVSIESNSGIIYFHDENDEIMCIENASNIQKRIFSIINQNKKHDLHDTKLYTHTRSITIDYISREFKAEMKALNDIQTLRPKFNKVMKPHNNSFSIHMKEDEHQLLYLNIIKKNNLKEDIQGPIIYTNSFKNSEKIKQKIMYSQDLSLLPSMKKQILRVSEDLKPILVKEYNDLMRNKIYKEFSCPFSEGYYVFDINSDNEVEAIRIKDHYLHSWGRGLIENNEIINYQPEFNFDPNQKITRKFLNILPKTSYKIVKSTI